MFELNLMSYLSDGSSRMCDNFQNINISQPYQMNYWTIELERSNGYLNQLLSKIRQTTSRGIKIDHFKIL